MSVRPFRRRRGGEGRTWREIPLTDYEADLLRRVAGEEANRGTWRETLLRQIAERFQDSTRFGVRL